MLAVVGALAFSLPATVVPSDGASFPGELTLDLAIDLALARNPALQAVRSGVDIAQAGVVTAGLRPNPELSVESEEYPYFSATRPSFFSGQVITAGVEYEIQTKRRRSLRTSAAEAEVRRSGANLEDAARLLRLDVRTAFYRVLLAESNRQLAEAILGQTDQVIELNRARFEQGEISGLELTRIEVERLSFADDLFQARLELRNAKAALLALLNSPDIGLDVQVRGELDEMPPMGIASDATGDDLLEMALERRPDFRAALAQLERASAQQRVERAVANPNVTVRGGYQRAEQNHSLVAEIAIPLTIFNRNQGEIMRSNAEALQAESLLAAARLQVALEVRQAHNAVEVNRERVNYIRTRQVSQAQEASRVTLAAYRLGGVPLMNYLDAQRRYRDTMRVLNQALFDERLSVFQLAAAIGGGNQP